MNFLSKTVTKFFDDECTSLAAAIAYYTALSLPPLLYALFLILTTSMSFVFETDEAERRAREAVAVHAQQLLGAESATVTIRQVLDQAVKLERKGWQGLLSFAGVIVAASAVVASLQNAFNRVWKVKVSADRSQIWQVVLKRLVSFAMIICLGFLLMVSLVLSSLIASVGDQLEVWVGINGSSFAVVNQLVHGLVIFLIFGLMFRFMPDAKVPWRFVALGAALTTVLFVLGRVAIQMYFYYFPPGQHLGGAAASLVGILVWVYYTSVIVLVGAEATESIASLNGHRHEPESLAESTAPETASVSAPAAS